MARRQGVERPLLTFDRLTSDSAHGPLARLPDMSSKTSYSPWRPHPWHGLPVGPEPPRRVNAFIEITPHDLVKYEIDKESGYLRLDRPQRTSAHPPSLYGFVPRTYCGKRVAKLMEDAEEGDGDPLDICVLCERPVARAEILLEARILGGLPMVDDGEADDKLIAVLESDHVWGHIGDIGGVRARCSSASSTTSRPTS